MTRRNFLKLTTISIAAAVICDRVKPMRGQTDALVHVDEYTYLMHSSRGGGKTLLSKHLKEQMIKRKEFKAKSVLASKNGNKTLAEEYHHKQLKIFHNINESYGAYARSDFSYLYKLYKDV